MSDPTARAARRNLVNDEYAVVTLLGAGGKTLYLDAPTTAALMGGLEIHKTLSGKFYGRIKKNAPAPAATGDEGQASPKGHN